MMREYLKRADQYLLKKIESFNHFFSAKRILVFTLLMIALHAVISLCFNTQIYRDVAGVYAWYGREFAKGIWWDIPISRVPPLNIFLCGLMGRLGFEAYTALILISLFFLALTLRPLYKLLSLFCSGRTAAFGCLLWAFAPRVLRFSGTGLLEATRDFFLVSSCYLILKSWRMETRWYEWVYLGLFLGGLTLSRGEGGLMAAFLMIGLLIRPATDYKSIKTAWKHIVFPIILTVAVSAASISPTLIQNYKVTGYPVPDARMIGVIQLVPVVNSFFTPRLVERDQDPRILPHERELSGGSELALRARDFFKNFFRGAYELYFSFAILGVIVFLVQRRWRKEYSFLLLYCLLISPIFIFFSVAHRYFIFVIPLLMVFTLAAIEEIFVFFRKYHAENLVLAGLTVIILVQPLNAWLWMTRDSDCDELIIKQYIQENRFQFPSGRKLKIHGDTRMVFRSGEDRLFHYGEYIPPAKYITGFDVMLVKKKNTQDVADCMARRDLKIIQSPFRCYVVFVPDKEKNE